jgi:fructosamine-3-kinase
MSLPAPLLEVLQTRFGRVGRCHPVSGGSVNQAHRVETERKGPIFVKHNPAAPAGLFRAEAEGLRALAEAAREPLVVPRVIAFADADGRAPAWIALEWLDGTRCDASAEAHLGRGLALLHGRRQAGWGWHQGNFIGALPQANTPRASWTEFWRDHRLAPQLRRAVDAGHHPGRPADWEQLFARLGYVLATAEAEGPSLIHGDLWSGNVLATARGPALVDPAVYHGHREVDLAMAELFGGFGDAFRAAYQETLPLQPGYPRERRPVYQLYYLLVHVNLFGAPYVEQTAALLRACLTA